MSARADLCGGAISNDRPYRDRFERSRVGNAHWAVLTN
jgi:hypothetical protein